ncbi:MAG: S8 family serine peptidase [Candidatus Dadabacteria bacterium]|nr:S8 family serine peptidase [Candidatus Dadabacteria bacterium]NIV42172.1 S8 family serine peptidase [Candidatus Dadabacteria bacterium]NIX16511.1 S8 family serine peptidase [Candidatus Dadabacteria bacterium]
MNRLLSSISAVLAILLILSSYNANAEIVGSEVYQKLNSQDKVRVIVVLDSTDTRFNDLSQKVAAIDDKKLKVLSKLSSSEFSLSKSWDTINAFSGFVSLEGLYKLSNDTNVIKVDLDLGGKGGLNQSRFVINADDVNDAGFTGQGVRVAVLDTGVDTNGIDLEDDIVGQQCFCENNNGSGCCPNGNTAQSGNGSAEDDNGHGTNIAGIITSDGFVAPEGIARDAQIVAVKVLDSNNSFSNTSQIISGLEWVQNNRPDVDVINMSLGTSLLFGTVCDDATAANMALAQVIQNLVNSGVIVFASTQNDGSINSIASPACLSNTLSVGAVFDGDNGSVSVFDCTDQSTNKDKVACFSNANANMDLLAPGSQITSTGINIGISTQSGTSQASAHASAAAALLLEADSDLSQSDIRQVLRNTGATVQDNRNGLVFPRIDILAAINFITGLNIVDQNNSPTSLCSVGGKVTPLQFTAIMLIYLVPVLFIVIRRYYYRKN